MRIQWDLTTKLGALVGPTVQRAGVAVVDLPLFGSDSIIGRSIVIHDPSGNRWVCATINRGGRVPDIRDRTPGPAPTGGSGAPDAVSLLRNLPLLAFG